MKLASLKLSGGVLMMLLCAAMIFRGRAMLSMSDYGADPDHYRLLAGSLVQGNFGYDVGAYNYEFTSSRINPALNPQLVAPLTQFGWTWPWVPTAYRPPLYPLMMAIPLKLLPNSDTAAVVHGVLGLITIVAVYRLGLAWGLPQAGAVIAAGLVTVDPLLVAQSAVIMTETMATCLAALALLFLTKSCAKNSIRVIPLTGVLLALCVLCRPTFLVWVSGVAAVLPFVLDANRKRAFALTALMVTFIALMLAPWVIRNWMVFGRPIITTTHGGYTLLLGNNPDFYKFLREGAPGSIFDPRPFNHTWLKKSDEYRIGTIRNIPSIILDEIECDRLAYQTAFENIRNAPRMFAYACLVRVGYLWGVLPHATSGDESPTRRGLRYAVAIWYACELPLAALGAWFLGRRLLRAPWVFGTLLLVSFTLVHAFYWTDMRMRAPLVPVITLLAAQAIVVLASPRRVVTPEVAAV